MHAQPTYYRPLALTVLPNASTVQRYAMMAALVVAGSILVALCAQIKVNLPFTPVPITGQTFAVLTVGGLLGSRLGAASLVLYMLEGTVGILWGSHSSGLPFFADGNHGWAIIEGSTGGYIVGFIFAAYLAGWFTERGLDRNPVTATFGLFLANAVVYIPGLIWLDHWVHEPATYKFFTDNGISTDPLVLGLYPYILGDFAKLILAAGVLPLGWGLLRQLPGYKSAFPQLSGEVRARDYRLALAWVYLPIAALVVVGTLLPWGVVAGDKELGVTLESGQFALGAGVVAMALSTVAFGKRMPWEITRVGLFACGAVAGFASFYQIADILEARNETFALAPLGVGLIISGLASVGLASASLLDREEDSAGTDVAAG
jgi:biotin transport system substrate-specific component